MEQENIKSSSERSEVKTEDLNIDTPRDAAETAFKLLEEGSFDEAVASIEGGDVVDVEEELEGPSSDADGGEAVMNEGESVAVEPELKADEPSAEEDSVELAPGFSKEELGVLSKIPTSGKLAINRLIGAYEQNRRELQSSRDFSRQVTEGLKEILPEWKSRAVDPVSAIIEGSKLAHLIQTSRGEDAVKTVMALTGVKSADIDRGTFEKFEDSRKQVASASEKSQLTQGRPLTENDVARIVEQREAARTNLAVIEEVAGKTDASGALEFPGLSDNQFMQRMQPILENASRGSGGPLTQDMLVRAYNATAALYGYATKQATRADSKTLQPQRKTTSDAERKQRLARAVQASPKSSDGGAVDISGVKIPDDIRDTAKLAFELLEKGS